MTSKTLERVADAIKRAAVMAHQIPLGSDRTTASAAQQAQAAIDALDIIILPHDAEPEVGDLVISRGVICEALRDDPPMDYVLRYLSALHYGCPYEEDKIIQRQGKPVIHEPKGNEDDNT